MESTGWAGGHKVIFEYANRLRSRHHDVTILSVNADWAWNHLFDLRVPIIPVGTYSRMRETLKHSYKDHIKIATWWKTAPVVAETNFVTGESFYLIQDIETSYELTTKNQMSVLATYDLPLTQITESKWVRKEMMKEGLGEPTFIGVGIDRKDFYHVIGQQYWDNKIIYHDRAHFLKGPELRNSILRRLKRTDFHTVGYSPWGSNSLSTAFLESPTDTQLAAEMRSSLALMSTSEHEGLCMPIMEAMAVGCAVVTTDADGNDFCVHNQNCIIAENTSDFLKAFHYLQDNPEERARLVKGGLETAEEFDWNQVIDRLEQTLKQ